jgi:pimeloyl-ACP methyl ester carboxylesterase
MASPRKPLTLLALILPLAAFVMASPAPAAAPAQGPPGTAFYTPPSPLPSGANGSVIWARDLTGPAALKSAARNVLVLYRTTTVEGSMVAVSGTIAFPRGAAPPDGWPVISWAHGTTGNAPQCAPSRTDEADYEQEMLDHWVSRGYVVAQTDYEGEGVPGVIHPYFVGDAAGHDVTDIVRAARALDPNVGSRFVAIGHSEGGNAALFTASVAPEWAPELKLLGTVSLAPGSHLVQLLMSNAASDRPSDGFPLTIMMVQGIASTDPDVDLTKVLSPYGLARLPDLDKSCADDLVKERAWTAVPMKSFFRDPKSVEPLLKAFLQNEPSLLALKVPVLLLQGGADTMVEPQGTALVDKDLCKRGASVEYDTFPSADHGSVLGASLGLVERWVDARFAGAAPHPNCA